MQHHLNKIYGEFVGGYESSFGNKKPKSVTQILNSIKERILENKELKLSSKRNTLKSKKEYDESEDEQYDMPFETVAIDDTESVSSVSDDDSDFNADTLKTLLLNASNDPLNLDNETDTSSEESYKNDEFDVNFVQRSGGNTDDEESDIDINDEVGEKSDDEIDINDEVDKKSDDEVDINDEVDKKSDEIDINDEINENDKKMPYTIVDI